MAIYSHPWTSIGGDRAVSDEMDAAYFAATHGNLVLTGLKPTLSGTDVSVAPGTAIIQGRVVTVDAPVTLTPTINRRARIVLRLDIANRTAEVALSGTTTSYPSLTRSGTVWELGLGTVDTTAATTVADTRADFALCGIYDTGIITFTGANWTARVQRVGNVITMWVDYKAATAAGASQTWSMDIPSYLLPTQTVVMAARGNNLASASASLSEAGSVSFRNNSSATTVAIAMSATYLR